MHRTHPSTTPQQTNHLPPFGGVGWFVAIVSELGRRRSLLRELRGLTTAQLKDIGLTEADVDAVRLQKLADDAASGLAATIRERGDNW